MDKALNTSQDTKKPRRWVQALSLLAIFSAALVLLRYGIDPVIDLLQRIDDLTEAHFFVAIAAYLVSFAVLATVGLPIGTLYCLAGGYLFGILGGAALAMAGSMASAIITFALARRHFSQGLQRWIDRGRVARLIHLLERDATWYLIVLRIVPIAPFFAVNAVAGLIAIAPLRFVVATSVGMLPIVAIYSSLGSGLGNMLEAGRVSGMDVLLQPAVFIPLTSLVGLIALGWWFRRRIERRKSS